MMTKHLICGMNNPKAPQPETRQFSVLKRPFPVYWLILAVAILMVDYATGSLMIFATLLFFPVAFASWFNGRSLGLALAIITPLMRLRFHFLWTSSLTVEEANTK